MATLVMAFDFGKARIGVAVGQQITGTANPIGTIRAKDGIPVWQDLDKLVEEWQPKRFVVGLPLNMDGTISEMADVSAKFARRLTGRYNIPHEMMDERLSTFEAREFADEEVDAFAAKLILETWLANQDRF